jgi:serine/threonine protein kinase
MYKRAPLAESNIPKRHERALSPKRKEVDQDRWNKTSGHLTNLNLDCFEIGPALGSGKYGLVFLAREKKSKFVCAIKVMIKEQLKHDHSEKQLRREIEIQASFR